MVSGTAVAGVCFLRPTSFCTRMPVAESARITAVAESRAARILPTHWDGCLSACVGVGETAVAAGVVGGPAVAVLRPAVRGMPAHPRAQRALASKRRAQGGGRRARRRPRC